jgi:hypothetical protein
MSKRALRQSALGVGLCCYVKVSRALCTSLCDGAFAFRGRLFHSFLGSILAHSATFIQKDLGQLSPTELPELVQVS